MARSSRHRYRKEKYSDNNLIFLAKSLLLFMLSFGLGTLYIKILDFLVEKNSLTCYLAVGAIFIVTVLGLWLWEVKRPGRLTAKWRGPLTDDLVMLAAIFFWVLLTPMYLVIPALAYLHRGLGIK